MGLRDLLRPFVPAWLRRFRHDIYIVNNSTYSMDGLATVHDADFLNDPLFRESYAFGKGTGSWGLSEPSWRIYIACWAGRHALRLEGDFVECGVNRGGLSLAVMHYTNFSNQNRRFYLLDTFAGFPDEMKDLAAGANRNDYSECYDDVVRTFSQFPNVSIIRGTIPQTLPQITATSIAFLSIDLNVPEAEVASLTYLWPRLVQGAVMSCCCRRGKGSF